ncbi:hypothetical protein [Nocardioides campestrisoli]|uniref:hypothetical protein n=1 Tax=Nocardioides campestrisoli TaxID=2736757 RepID=UPI00163DC9F2|nr:hypothetical protein [Nocardioides campestrisoli]
MSETVTITLPASEPAVLFKPEGDPVGIDALAAVVLEAAGRFDEYSDESQQFHRMRGWTGQSNEQYVERARRTAVMAGRMRNTLKRTGRVLVAGADRLRHHQRRYEEHVERKQGLDRDLEALRTELDAATDLTPAQVDALRQRAAELTRAYAILVDDDRALAERVHSNEELLADTLDSATSRDDVTATDGGRPEIAQRAMQHPGSPLGGGSSPAEVRQWWRGLSADERRAVVASYSTVVAEAEGVPPEVRERAERIRDEEVATRLGAKRADGTITRRETDRLARA